jgi:hypothetical protein
MVNIHGKEYITVAERLTKAHAELKQISITTEVLFQDPVVIKATVTTLKGVFTGISAANPSKAIEAQSPYEVAESSAVGRALAFAGYETVGGIASAEEMKKALDTTSGETAINKDIVDSVKEVDLTECNCHTTNEFHSHSCPKYHV